MVRARASVPGARGWSILSLVAVAAAATAMHGRMPQDQAYHRFADVRAFLGVPNALDVLSNAGFLAVGGWGLAVVLRSPRRSVPAAERWPWLVFLSGVVLTCAGSAYYHLQPGDGRLVWDRLPMTLGFMGLLAAQLGERIDPGLGRGLLLPLAVAGLASVAWWRWTELHGAGDLRPYLFVQFAPVGILPLLLLLYPARYTGAGALPAAIALYGAAKLAEERDAQLFARLGGMLSGHTLKHLLAAAAIACIVGMLATRRPVATGAHGAR